MILRSIRKQTWAKVALALASAAIASVVLYLVLDRVNRHLECYTLFGTGDHRDERGAPSYLAPSRYNPPRWTPDGDKIVFMHRNYTVNGEDVYVVSYDGSNLSRISTDYFMPNREYLGARSPDVSPDGTRVAYSRYTHIAVAAIDGSSRIDFIGDDDPNLGSYENWMDLSPMWSPDGERIAFFRYEQDECGDRYVPEGVYTVEPNGSGLLKVADIRGMEDVTGLSWSPDGQRLAFLEISREMNNEGKQLRYRHAIFIADSDGSGPVERVTPLLGSPGNPNDILNPIEWSPDSRRIAFGMWQDDDAKLYSINRDGSDLRELADPDVSHDASAQHMALFWRGSRIRFSMGYETIYEVNEDGSGFRAAGDYIKHPGLKEPDKPFIAWSPDGSKTAYLVPSFLGVVLYTVDDNEPGSPKIPAPTGKLRLMVMWSPSGPYSGNLKLVQPDSNESIRR